MIQAHIDGKQVNVEQVKQTVIVTRERFARCPRWLIVALEWFGVVTTEERTVEVFELQATPPAGSYAVISYQTTFGED